MGSKDGHACCDGLQELTQISAWREQGIMVPKLPKCKGPMGQGPWAHGPSCPSQGSTGLEPGAGPGLFFSRPGAILFHLLLFPFGGRELEVVLGGAWEGHFRYLLEICRTLELVDISFVAM